MGPIHRYPNSIQYNVLLILSLKYHFNLCSFLHNHLATVAQATTTIIHVDTYNKSGLCAHTTLPLCSPMSSTQLMKLSFQDENGDQSPSGLRVNDKNSYQVLQGPTYFFCFFGSLPPQPFIVPCGCCAIVQPSSPDCLLPQLYLVSQVPLCLVNSFFPSN